MALSRIGSTSREALLGATLGEFLILAGDRTIAEEGGTAVADALHVDIGQVIGLIDVLQLVKMMDRLPVRSPDGVPGLNRNKRPSAVRGITHAVSGMSSLNRNRLVRNQDDRLRTIRIGGGAKRGPTDRAGHVVVKLHAGKRGDARIIRDPALGRR